MPNPGIQAPALTMGLGVRSAMSVINGVRRFNSITQSPHGLAASYMGGAESSKPVHSTASATPEVMNSKSGVFCPETSCR